MNHLHFSTSCDSDRKSTQGKSRSGRRRSKTRNKIKGLQFGRLRHAVTWLVVATAFITTCSEIDASLIDEINDAYRHKYGVINSILVEMDVTVYSMIGDEAWFRRFGAMPNLTGRQVVVAAKDGRIYIQQITAWEEIAASVYNEVAAIEPKIRQNPEGIREMDFSQVKAIVEALWKRQESSACGKVQVFDGQQLLETRPGVKLNTAGVERSGFRIVAPTSLSTRFLPETVLDVLLFSFNIPGLPSESQYRAKNRIPEMWQQEGFSSSPSYEEIDSVECIVFGSAASGRVFFAPSLDFAVKRREWYLNGELIYLMNATDFEEVATNVWLPHSLDFKQYAHRDFGGGEYSGKPTHRIEYRAKTVNINSVDNSKYLTVEVPAGSWVIDETIPMLDKSGNPLVSSGASRAVSYLQPADQSDLERVIKDAQKEMSTASSDIGKPASVPLIVSLNVAAMAAIAVVVVLRKFRS